MPSDRRGDPPRKWRRPPETTVEPVPLRRPYVPPGGALPPGMAPTPQAYPLLARWRGPVAQRRPMPLIEDIDQINGFVAKYVGEPSPLQEVRDRWRRSAID